MLEFFAMAVLNAAVLALMFLYLKARIRKYLEINEIVSSLREEVGRLMLELNQTTDRNLGLVEDGIERLKDAVAKADRKIAAVNREIGKRDTQEITYTKLARSKPIPRGEAVPEEVKALREALEPRDQEAEKSIPGSVKESNGDGPRDSGQERDVTDFDVIKRNILPEPPARDKVVSLFKKGFSTDMISSRLSMPIGEVEIIVSIEEQRSLMEP